MTRSNVSFMLRRVYERLTAGAGAIALTAFMLVVSDARASTTETTRMGPSTTVTYSIEDLATDAGAAKVYRKLKFAARKVCGVGSGDKELERQIAARKCFDASLSEAVRKVDRPLLSTLHDAAIARRMG